jgi:flagellar assembly protein FliH
MTATLLPRDQTHEIARHAMPTMTGPIVGEHRAGAHSALNVQDIARIREEAHQRAYAEGHAKAYAETKQRIEREISRLGQLCAGLAAPLAAVDDAVVETVAELAVTIARHLVRRELKHAPGEVVGVVREAMRQLPLATRRARIHLHPDDYALVQEALAVRADTAWQLEADPLIARGGCVVETESSRIDAQVESRIAAIAAKMFGGERGEDRGH